MFKYIQTFSLVRVSFACYSGINCQRKDFNQTRILLLGGHVSASSLELYYPSTPTKNTVLNTTMAVPRLGHASAVMSNGLVLSVGGLKPVGINYIVRPYPKAHVCGGLVSGISIGTPYIHNNRHLGTTKFGWRMGLHNSHDQSQMVAWLRGSQRNTLCNRGKSGLAFFDMIGIGFAFMDKIAKHAYAGDNLWPRIGGFLINVSWYGILLHQLLLSIERFMGLLTPALYSKVIEHNLLQKAIFFAWLMAFGSNMLMFTETYGYVYNGPDHTLFYNLSNPKAVLFNHVRELIVQPTLLIVVCTLYLVTGFKIRAMRKQLNNARKVLIDGAQTKSAAKTAAGETRIFLIAVLVTAPHALSVLFFHLLWYFPNQPSVLAQTWTYLSFGFAHLLWVINPGIYILFSSEIQNLMFEFYFGERMREIRKSSSSEQRIVNCRSRSIQYSCKDARITTTIHDF